jgi:hypothetical protein
MVTGFIFPRSPQPELRGITATRAGDPTAGKT